MNAKLGRNDTCDCGSGKKYKKCCGASGAIAAAPVTHRIDLAGLQQLLSSGQFMELETSVRVQLAENPRSAVLYKLLGAALHAQNRDALEALESAARFSPHDAEAHSNLGNLLRARGRLAEAEECQRRALAISPSYAKAHNNLGSVLRDLKRNEQAAESFLSATRLEPGFVLAHCNLGIVLRELGRPQEAIAAHRRVLALVPTHAESVVQIGIALCDLGRREEALASYKRALVLEPDHIEALTRIGDLMLELGLPESAVAPYERLLALRPDAAEVHGNLGNALRAIGRTDAARAAYERALALRPLSPEMHNNLGNGLFDIGRFDDAVLHYQRAIELNPTSLKAHSNMGSALRELNRFDEALDKFEQALSLEPHSVEVLTNIAIVQRQLGRPEEAAARLTQALALAPEAVTAATLRADLAVDRGDFEGAEALYREAFARDSSSAVAWAGIATTHRMTAADRAWWVQAEELASHPLRPRDEVLLRFAMGKYLDDVADYDKAFANYHRANELVKSYRQPHDRELLANTFDYVKQLYDRTWIAGARAPSAMRRQPIFVVGMPRSGTSLAEQILASHPAVFGAGELPFWKAASMRVGAQSLAGGPSPALMASLAAEYGQVLESLAPNHPHVVDKMPSNFAHLAMIHAAVPGARIIHMRRNPIDTCLSIYFQNFHLAHTYSNDLGDLAHYYDEYRGIMRYWGELLPADAVLDVPYEALVADPELWTRRMLEFVGLPWDDACLNSHRTDRTVRTFSRWQVKQKISTRSVERWRRYAAHVGPLLRLDTVDTAA